MNQSSVTKIKNNGYKKYSPQELRESVLGWIMQKPQTNLTYYCQNINVPRTTIKYVMKQIPDLAKMRQSMDSTLKDAEIIYDFYIEDKEKNRSQQVEKACEANCYMDEDEEGTLANMAILIAASGRGITKNELLELINLVLKEKNESTHFVPATMKTVHGLLKRNKQLSSKVRSASSIDPSRSAQATKETRDSMFTKLNNYIVLLHELGVFKEKNYCEINSQQIYNMDECALDTTRQKRKVLCSKEDLHQLFQITPEGDGKMGVHVTLALTSRAGGTESIYLFYFLFLILIVCLIKKLHL